MRRSLFRCASKTASVISVPMCLGQPLLGADKSPYFLRENRLQSLLASCGWRVNLVPDIVSPMVNQVSNDENDGSDLNAKNCAEIGAISHRVSQQVYEHAKTNDFLLILGGDHSISIGTVPGIMKARQNTGIVWVDAHADINTPATSESGNMHGMPLGFLLGLVDNVRSYPSMNWFQPCVDPKDMCYIGLRDLDSEEKKIVRKLGIKAFTMYDIDKYGIGKVMEMANDHLDGKNIHLSYDIDALDPFFAPHTGTAVRGGLTFREGNYICENLYETGRMTSMELVEVNPSLCPHIDVKTTIEMAATLIGSSMGQRIL